MTDWARTTEIQLGQDRGHVDGPKGDQEPENQREKDESQAQPEISRRHHRRKAAVKGAIRPHGNEDRETVAKGRANVLDEKH